jgi:hypothetical protein
MHFRIRNNVVQVIRTTYDSTTKKARTEIVGRLQRADLEPGHDLLEACTSAEVEEVKRWIDSHMKAHAVAAEHAARTLADQTAKAAAWFASTDDLESARVLAAEVQQQWVKLRNQFRRSGLLDWIRLAGLLPCLLVSTFIQHPIGEIMTTIPELIASIRDESPNALGKLNDRAALRLLRAAFSTIAREMDQAPDGVYRLNGLGTFNVRTVEANAQGKGGGRRIQFKPSAPKAAPKE